MPIVYQDFIRREDLRRNPDWFYLFGDNEMRQGMGGQAASMRGEPNAIGIRTKFAPNNSTAAFWHDEEYERCRALLVEDFAIVEAALKDGKTVVVPRDGLGTGLSELPTRAPRAFSFICAELHILEVTYEGGGK